MKRTTYLLTCFLLAFNAFAQDITFSKLPIEQWQEKSFVGNTRYSQITNGADQVIYAHSDSSSSGLFKQVDIELKDYPILQWRWKIARTSQNLNERSRSGDDYPARLYLFVNGEPYFWSKHILVYVWADQSAVGSMWPSPYSSDFKLLAVDSGEKFAGQWRHYQRDVMKDFYNAFGFNPQKIDTIAIMTDSDNTGQVFEAWYANIQFSE